MARIVICPDGSVVRGDSDDELVAGVEAWLISTNPRLSGTLSRAEILARAVDEESRTEATNSAGANRERAGA